MTETVSLSELSDRLLAAQGPARRLVALAGPPGVGKTSTAARLVDRLNGERPGIAAILGMDGFHFDDRVLHARGHRPRKGAPHTFDLGGLRAAIRRLKRDDGADVAVPVFDRDIETARAGAAVIEPSVRLVMVEGNYLLLDAPGWRDLKPLFDATVRIHAAREVVEARLRARWEGYGLSGEAMRAKMEDNDLPNMRLVMDESLPADFALRTDAT